MLDSMMTLFAERHNLPPLSKKNDRYTLTLDGRTDVTVFDVNGRLYFTHTLMTLPSDLNERGALLTSLLEKNAVVMTEDPIALSVVGDELQLCLSRTANLVDFGQLQELINDCANYAQLYRGYLQG